MEKNTKIFIGVIGLILLVGVFLFARNLPRNSSESIGSVSATNEYFSTTTPSNSNVGSDFRNNVVLSSGTGALGSVVITGANTGTFTIYDATSTRTNTEWATTTLATFPASVAAGTYTFDIIYRRGLLVNYTGLLATTTITWR